MNTKCMTLVDMWKKMYHPNIIQLREVFTTKAFGDHCKCTCNSDKKKIIFFASFLISMLLMNKQKNCFQN